MEVVNLARKLASINEYFSPRVAAEVGDMQVRLVKVKGEFLWHHHEREDELFLIVKGRLTIRLRDRDLHLSEGEMVVIPHGVEHMPVAEEEAQVLLLEPKTTLNTGNVRNERTVNEPAPI
ncbi:MAG TPA: cupin domain-containing protein [Gemmatimonadota bacterium]|jgi:mannose-6-phosphate isomerase-like protein (cupin superfamily)